MRNFFDAIKSIPHPEERHGKAGARLEGRRLLMQHKKTYSA